MMKASGTAPTYTHVKLSSGASGAKGYIVSEDADTGTVVIHDDKGVTQEYDKDTLHLVWAPTNWSEQS